MSAIEVVHDGPVARLRLNRPQILNSLSPQLLRELISACDQLKQDNGISVVVLEGSGGVFSAGADLPAFEAELAASPAETADLGRNAADALADLPHITIALIEGHCIGGGLVLAAACDVRVAASDSEFRIPELEAGIPLAWGGLGRLVQLIGEAAATELVLSCRRFGAAEALRLGVVSSVVSAAEFETVATEFIELIASRAQLPLRVTKAQLRAIRANTYDARGDADALLQVLSDPVAAAELRSYTNRLR